MSIQTELTRITNAKAAIKAAVEGKGVTVPDGTLLDGMAALIEAIEAGGGGLEYNRLYPAATGTFTVTERTAFSNDSPYILQHDAGVIPILVTIISNGMKSQGDLDALAMWRTRHYSANYYDKSRTTVLSVRRGSTSSSLIRNLVTESGSAKADLWSAQSVPVFCYNTTLYFNAGKNYSWIAYGVD